MTAVSILIIHTERAYRRMGDQTTEFSSGRNLHLFVKCLLCTGYRNTAGIIINSCHVLFFWVSLRPFRHDFKKISKFSSHPARPSIIISCPLEIVSRKKNKRKRNYWRSWRKLPNSVGRTPGFKENLTGKRFAKEDSSWRRRAREEFTEQNEILRRKRRRCET